MGHVFNPKHQSNQIVPAAYNWARQMGHGSRSSGVRPPQTPEQKRDHATVETETH